MLNCFEEISQNLEFFGFCPVVETLLDITPIFTGNDVSWVYFDLQNFGDMATYFFPSFFKIIFKARIKKKIRMLKYVLYIQREQHVFFTFPTIFHYISWACFFNPQRGIACFPSRNTLHSGNPRYVMDCCGNPSQKTWQHFMDL